MWIVPLLGAPLAETAAARRQTEVQLRLRDLEQAASATNDTMDGVYALLNHRAIAPFVAHAIHTHADGTRLRTPAFVRHTNTIYQAHNLQTEYERRMLELRYRAPLLGRVDAWDLLRLLHFTIDHTDRFLMYTSQLIHCLQVFAGVQREVRVREGPRGRRGGGRGRGGRGVAGFTKAYRSDMLVSALVHDLGKTLTLFGESDTNVDCMNRIVAYHGNGLDALEAHWNHDEFAFARLRGDARLSRRVKDVLRFHSLRESNQIGKPVPAGYHATSRGDKDSRLTRADWVALANHTGAADRARAAFVAHFAHFDAGTKRITPRIPLELVPAARDLMRRTFPHGIVW